MRPALAVATLALCADVLSQQPSPAPTKSGQPQETKTATSQQKAADDKRGTEQSPAIIKILPTPKSEAEAAQERKDREEKTTLDRELVSFTGWLVVATLVLAAIGLLQLLVFGLQARRLRQTVRTMEDTAERQLRAYISVKATQVRNFGTGQRVEFSFTIENTGQTPAYNVATFSGMFIAPYPLPAGQSKIAVPAIQPISAMIVGPPVSSYKAFDRPLTAAEIASIVDGAERRLYIGGVVVYEDTFRKQKRHTWFGACIGGPKLAEAVRLGMNLDIEHLFEYPSQLNDAD